MSNENADPRFELAANLAQAAALRHEGRYSEAIEVLHSLRKRLESAGLRSGAVFEEMAESLSSAGRADDAKAYYGLAFAELSRDPKTESSRLDRLARLGDVDGE
jgi:tetratricopeptide (TPR) repeat protein